MVLSVIVMDINTTAFTVALGKNSRKQTKIWVTIDTSTAR